MLTDIAVTQDDHAKSQVLHMYAHHQLRQSTGSMDDALLLLQQKSFAVRLLELPLAGGCKADWNDEHGWNLRGPMPDLSPGDSDYIRQF